MSGRIFGDHQRYLINKHADGTRWLVHEPVRGDALPATIVPTFEAACRLAAAFIAKDAARLNLADAGHETGGPAR
jgi:hypothetical protein